MPPKGRNSGATIRQRRRGGRCSLSFRIPHLLLGICTMWLRRSLRKPVAVEDPSANGCIREDSFPIQSNMRDHLLVSIAHLGRTPGMPGFQIHTIPKETIVRLPARRRPCGIRKKGEFQLMWVDAVFLSPLKGGGRLQTGPLSCPRVRCPMAPTTYLRGPCTAIPSSDD